MDRQKEQGKQVRLMFQDEGRFGRINDHRRCWAPLGIRPDVPHQIVREYSYVFAALSPHDGILDSLILPQVNSETMSLFLYEVSKRHAHEFILMVMDQASWHTGKKLLVPENITLILLPPHSPQCNPAEHLWDEIREKWFANRVFNSMNAVENQLVESLIVLENDPQRIHLLTAFKWIINSIHLNAT